MPSIVAEDQGERRAPLRTEQTTLRKVLAAAAAIYAVLTFPAVAAADQQVLLTDLNLKNSQQDWLSAALVNIEEKGAVPTIGSMSFTENVYVTNASAVLAIDLNGKAIRFTGVVGSDVDSMSDPTWNPKLGHIQFGIWDDRGMMLWQSGVLAPGDEGVTFDVPLTGSQRIYLLSDKTEDDFYFDHADWASGTFTIQDGATIRSVRLTAPSPTISLTEPGASPEINSPTVMGVRPGTPFLHTIAATGTRPLAFDATGLPLGLTLDPATGQITGTVADTGDYHVTLKASNASGSDQRDVTIKVGNQIALTPPLGWNSYDSYGDSVTAAEILANAQWMKDNLQPFGWEYTVVDFRWYDPKDGGPLTVDTHGRLLPAPNRFPDGFEGLSTALHQLGLKFGFHLMRGIARTACTTRGLSGMYEMTIDGSTALVHDACNTASLCSWNSDMYGAYSSDVSAATPAQLQAGLDWYSSLSPLFSGWEPDLIKADDMFNNDKNVAGILYKGEITPLLAALAATKRSVVLSLSPGPELSQDPNLTGSADFLQANANSWRIANDLWDDWQYVDTAFIRADAWKTAGAVGHWPDADMLPLGYLGPRSPAPAIQRTQHPAGNRPTLLSRNEQLTMMTLWSIMPSPMMLGTSLADARTASDTWTRHLLTNNEVLAVNQDPLGARAQRFDGGTIDPEHLYGIEAWVKPLADGRTAVAVFNRSLVYQRFVDLPWTRLGLSQNQTVRDLWNKTDLGVMRGSLSVTLPSHGAAFFVTKDAPASGGTGGSGGMGGSAGTGDAPAAGMGGDSATGGVAAGEAGSPSIATGGQGEVGGSTTSGSAKNDSGCGCRVVQSGRSTHGAFFTLAGLAWVAYRRRRRLSSQHAH
jgi:MYXO-CTERM domain-containing protein